MFKGETSLKKIYNTYLNYISYKTKRPDVLGYPTGLMIEPTNNCNLKCPLCPTGSGIMKRKKEFMPFELYKRILDEVGDFLYHLSLWHYGEPMMHPDIYKFIRYAKDKNVDFVKISTNGHFFGRDEQVESLIRSKLDNIMVCMDGACQESLDKYRSGGNFNLVVEGMKRIAGMKKTMGSQTPELELQFIIMKHNEKEVPKVRDIARKVGVNILTLRACDVGLNFDEIKERSKDFVPDNTYHPFFERDNEGSIKMKKEPPNYCHCLWSTSVITCGGKVVPCCYDPDEDLVMGDISESSFKEIWQGKRYVNFRKQILTNRKEIEKCANCIEGVAVETNYSSERLV